MNRRRRSPRSEVSQETIDLLSVLIQKSEFPIPDQAAVVPTRFLHDCGCTPAQNLVRAGARNASRCQGFEED